MVSRRAVLKGAGTLGVAGLAGGVQARGCALDWGKRLNGRREGEQVVNATQEVVNDIDHGHNGYWASLDYRRVIEVWEVDGGIFEAVVTYNGQFDGVAGQQSYRSGDELTGEENGTIHGGYVATIHGSMLEDPHWPTHGFVGTTDYDGDVKKGERGNPVRWQDKYLDVASFGYDWWGWIYHGGRCGTLVAAVDEQCGDVICDS